MSEFEFEGKDNLCEFCIHAKECKYANAIDENEECEQHKELWQRDNMKRYISAETGCSVSRWDSSEYILIVCIIIAVFVIGIFFKFMEG